MMKRLTGLLLGIMVIGGATLAQAQVAPLLVADFDGETATWFHNEAPSTGTLTLATEIYQLPTTAGGSMRMEWDTTAGEWAGGGLAALTLDASTYGELSFWIRAAGNSYNMEVKLESAGQAAIAELADYVDTQSNTWQQVSIPIAAFLRSNNSVNLSTVTTISWISLADTQVADFYIDNVRLTSQPRSPAGSIIFSGGDTGSDLPGDTFAVWDGTDPVTTNLVTVDVEEAFAVSWLTNPPEVSYEAQPGSVNWFAFQVGNEGNTADRIVLSTQNLAGETWPTNLYWDRDATGAYDEARDIEWWDTIGTLPGTAHSFLTRIEIPVAAVEDTNTTVRVSAKSSGSTAGWEGVDNVQYDFSLIAKAEPVIPDPENLLANTSFEEQEGEGTWNPLHWDVVGNASRENYEPRTGTWSLMIQNWGDFTGHAHQTVAAVAGNQYNMSAWTVREGTVGDVPLHMTIEWLDASQVLISSITTSIVPQTRVSEGGDGWAQSTLSGIAPVDTGYVRVKVGGTNVASAGYFDDVLLEETPVNMLVNASFEEGTGQGYTIHPTTTAITGWTHWGDGFWASDVAHEGTWSIKRYNIGTGIFQDFTAIAGNAYEVSLQAYDGSVEPLSAFARLALKVEWYTDGDVKIGDTVTAATLSGGGTLDAWVILSSTVNAPANTAYGRFFVATEEDGGTWGGSVFFDSASVLNRGEAPPAPAVNLLADLNWSFEDWTGTNVGADALHWTRFGATDANHVRQWDLARTGGKSVNMRALGTTYSRGMIGSTVTVTAGDYYTFGGWMYKYAGGTATSYEYRAQLIWYDSADGVISTSTVEGSFASFDAWVKVDPAVAVQAPAGAVNARVQNHVKRTGGAAATTDAESILLDDAFINTADAPVGDPVVSISKAASAASVRPGETVTFTLTYGNSGFGAAANLVITDAIPFNTTLTDSVTNVGGETVEYYYDDAWTGVFNASAEKVRWSRATLGAGVTGQEVEFTVVVK